jgi:hypothetical protein
MNTADMTQPQRVAWYAYQQSCERLANASIAMRRAQVEYENAIAEYGYFHGAAQQAGVIEK